MAQTPIRRRITAATLVLVVLVSPGLAQEGIPVPEFPAYEPVPDILRLLSPILLPKVVADVWSLKEYIRGDDFRRFRRTFGDVASVDAIFDRAVRLSWNNLYQALFVSLIATMDHDRFGVHLPLIGPLLWFPLTSEDEEEFQRRVTSLPCELYPDLPEQGCDRDKLQHFFGSAFITFTFESRESAERVGEFVEWGEQRFIVDGATDTRDQRANRQGQEFGLRLLEDESARPSAALRYVLAVCPAPEQVRQPSESRRDSLHHESEGR